MRHTGAVNVNLTKLDFSSWSEDELILYVTQGVIPVRVREQAEKDG